MNTDTPIISGGDSLLKSPSRSILGINFEAPPVLSPAFRFSQQIPTHILIQRDCRNRRSELRLILLSKRGMPRLQKSTLIIVVTQHFYCENCKKGFHPVNSYHSCYSTSIIPARTLTTLAYSQLLSSLLPNVASTNIFSAFSGSTPIIVVTQLKGLWRR